MLFRSLDLMIHDIDLALAVVNGHGLDGTAVEHAMDSATGQLSRLGASLLATRAHPAARPEPRGLWPVGFPSNNVAWPTA